jgi:hypothetical protein
MKKDSKSKIVFLCGARDFHAMDWYFSAKEIVEFSRLEIVTDLIVGEGYNKLVNRNDKVYKLLILDKFLFKSQSRVGDIWRNILKLLVMPLQVLLLCRYNKKNPNSIYLAHSMYYLWLANFAGLKFIGTPQGSDILIKPFKSKLFKYLSVKALKSAAYVTVDSEMMKLKCIEISGVSPLIIQNGIDLKAIMMLNTGRLDSSSVFLGNKILSVRGFTPLYRIKHLNESRDLFLPEEGINFIYPFFDERYKFKLSENDNDFGRVERKEMYELMNKSILVVSIPSSDSSPRSVYEAIFCNSIVVITYHKYYDHLPECMKARIILANIENENWLNEAFLKALNLKKQYYQPSEEALNLFDQRRSFSKILSLINNEK